jgi:hypothetical protein
MNNDFRMSHNNVLLTPRLTMHKTLCMNNIKSEIRECNTNY